MKFDWRNFPKKHVQTFWLLSVKRPQNFTEYESIIKFDNVIFPIKDFVNKHLKNYPAPMNLNLSWTFGALSMMALIIQIVTGFCLTMHYVPHTLISFDGIEHIMRDVNFGYLLRYTHANGASFYFICLYSHLFRSLYYKTFIKNVSTWQVGVVILLLSMATAFLGYVLPWGQMSFWGATVITNLFSVIPFMGFDVVHALWGGYGVGTPTLNRFYSLHFLLPLVILWLVIVHILLLHEKGSSTPNKAHFIGDVISFWSFFGLKDSFLLTNGFILFCLFLIFGPNILNHPDNYIPADPMQTPAHIVPEWYFLPFYAILRAIPNKVFGVIAMALSILVLFLLPLKRNKSKPKTTNTMQLSERLVFWLFIVVVLYLGYLGGMPIEWPFNLHSFIFCILYFILIWAISADLPEFYIKFFNSFLTKSNRQVPTIKYFRYFLGKIGSWVSKNRWDSFLFFYFFIFSPLYMYFVPYLTDYLYDLGVANGTIIVPSQEDILEVEFKISKKLIDADNARIKAEEAQKVAESERLKEIKEKADADSAVYERNRKILKIENINYAEELSSKKRLLSRIVMESKIRAKNRLLLQE